MSVPLSVAICTRNRPALLLNLLHILLFQARPHGVPIIVVDSASTPPASKVVKSLGEPASSLQLVRLDQPGLSLARNVAFQTAQTPWIGFIDDDEIPGPTWVSEALALVDRLPPRCAACGGNVLPRWPYEQRPRLGPRWRDFLSIIDQAGEFDQTAHPKFGGGHSVFRVKAFAQSDGFDERLGRDGKSLLSGEEVQLIDQLVELGWQIWHSDRLSVAHVIEPERLQRAWAIDRAFWEGVSTMRRARISKAGNVAEVARRTRFKLWFLRPLAALAIFGSDWDIKLAFARGMLSEEPDAAEPAAKDLLPHSE